MRSGLVKKFLLAFLDPRGRMGRLDYFKATILRGLIVGLIMVIYFVLKYLLLKAYAPDVTPSLEVWVEQMGESLNTEDSIISGIVNLLFFAPIEIRRITGLRIDCKWIAPGCLVFLMPWELITRINIGILFMFLFNDVVWVVELVLLFRPGQEYKDFVGSR